MKKIILLFFIFILYSCQENKDTLGIICAMKEEHNAVLSLMKDTQSVKIKTTKFIKGNINNFPVILTLSGIGKTMASKTVTLLTCNFLNIKYIANIGSSGELYGNGNYGDIIIGNSNAYWDFDLSEFGREIGEHPNVDRVLKVNSFFDDFYTFTKKNNSYNIKLGLVVTGDSFVNNKKELLKIKNIYPNSLVVEMEAMSIAHICKDFNIPFISIKSVSDFPLNNNNEMDFKEYLKLASKNASFMAKELILYIQEK